MAFLQRPARWLQAISRYAVTISEGPNFAFQLCVDKISDAEMQDVDLSTWQIAFNGAEPIRASTLNAFAERFAKFGFRRQAPVAMEPEDRVEQFAEYRRLKTTMQQMLMTGVPNPYFTVHEGVVSDTTVVGGKKLISFASYNYLGLSGHPTVTEAAAEALRRCGATAPVSRPAGWYRAKKPFTGNWNGGSLSGSAWTTRS